MRCVCGRAQASSCSPILAMVDVSMRETERMHKMPGLYREELLGEGRRLEGSGLQKGYDRL